MFNSKVHFLSQIPSILKIQNLFEIKKYILVICDKKLKEHSMLKKWKQNSFVMFYFVNPGEKTKSVENLEKHIKKIDTLTKGFESKELVFISLGGGSVGDLTGFLASIYKRGISFISIPTTFLAAIDSAHGGKNALNFHGAKNVIGTYYFPEHVFIVFNFFKSLSLKQKKSAIGELLKIGIISGGKLYSDLKKQKKSLIENWKPFIKHAISEKVKIVKKDTYQTKDIRIKLNLGHTLAHILEATNNIPHGIAVLYGTLFSLNWSFHKNIVKKDIFLEIESLIKQYINLKQAPKLTLQSVKKWIKYDKKYKKNKNLDFIFINKPGDVFSETVSEENFLKELKRQKWLK